MKNIFHFFTNKSKKPDKETVSTEELQEMLTESGNRLRGLRSTIKHFGAMLESGLKLVRKAHYAKLQDAAKELLEREEIEHATLETAINKRRN